MAQTIVVQEQALSAAQGRIQQLEHELASRPAGGGGFLSGLFGGGQTRPQPHQSYQPQPMHGMPPHMAPGMGGHGSRRGGGGFLAGAAQTAMGVAGGVLLGNMIAGAFSGGDEAKAADAGQAEPQQAAAEDLVMRATTSASRKTSDRKQALRYRAIRALNQTRLGLPAHGVGRSV